MSDLNITKEWFERRAKAEGDLEIGAGFSVVNMTDADIAQMEVLAERALPQWAQDELSRLRHILASAEGRAKNATSNLDYWRGQYDALIAKQPYERPLLNNAGGIPEDTRALLMSIETAARMAEQGILSADGGQAAVEIRSLIPLRFIGTSAEQSENSGKPFPEMDRSFPKKGEHPLTSVSKSLAAMITEYVEGGIRGGTDWRNGLESVIEKRLQRLSPTSETCVERVAELEAALKPFADCADEIDYGDREREEPTPDEEWAKFRLLVGDYRRARSALSETAPPIQDMAEVLP